MTPSLFDLPRAGAYQVALLDPAWAFRSHSGDVVPQRAATQHYPTMAIDALAALPVPAILAPDAAVFMWVSDTHVDQAMDLARFAWGLTYKTLAFVWDKGTMSFGYYSRKEGEFCYLFTRGRPEILPTHGGVRQFIRERKREHSRKPDDTRNRIERLIAGPYVELFGRVDPSPTWDVWGNEVGKFGRARGAQVV